MLGLFTATPSTGKLGNSEFSCWLTDCEDSDGTTGRVEGCCRRKCLSGQRTGRGRERERGKRVAEETVERAHGRLISANALGVEGSGERERATDKCQP